MSTISAGTTSTTTLIHSGDTTGSLVLKTNDTGSGGTTALTLGTDQSATFASTISATGVSGTAVATQANQEAASSTSTIVTPGRQQYHPSAAKAWVRGNMSGGTGTSYNVSSLTDPGVGKVIVNFTTAFSDVTYALSATASSNTDIWGQQYPTAGAAAVGSCGLGFVAGNRSLTDPDIFYAIFFGDQ